MNTAKRFYKIYSIQLKNLTIIICWSFSRCTNSTKESSCCVVSLTWEMIYWTFTSQKTEMMTSWTYASSMEVKKWTFGFMPWNTLWSHSSKRNTTFQKFFRNWLEFQTFRLFRFWIFCLKAKVFNTSISRVSSFISKFKPNFRLKQDRS